MTRNPKRRSNYLLCMLYITVKLFGRTGKRGEFRGYESKALELFRKHGGEVVVAYAPTLEKNQLERPDEIQVLKIPSRSQFEAFLNDPDRIRMSAERDEVIRRTDVFISDEINQLLAPKSGLPRRPAFSYPLALFHNFIL